MQHVWNVSAQTLCSSNGGYKSPNCKRQSAGVHENLCLWLAGSGRPRLHPQTEGIVQGTLKVTLPAAVTCSTTGCVWTLAVDKKALPTAKGLYLHVHVCTPSLRLSRSFSATLHPAPAPTVNVIALYRSRLSYYYQHLSVLLQSCHRCWQ